MSAGDAPTRALAAEQRHQAMLQAALDPIVTMDGEGLVVDFNAAAERVFGYAAADARGREMADLIVPPELRERHRAGLRRYLADGEPVLLDRRVEIDAVRADGVRIPVELAITRVADDGPPLFIGQLRDISDRRLAEEELRASRARIVEAGDRARRQLERDLHDGAQQQLVSVAIGLRLARTRLEADDRDGASQLVQEAADDLAQAIAELRELARGIHPAALTEGGVDPAVRALVRRSALPVRLGALTSERLGAAIESAAYFVVAEGLTNALRHATGATVVDVAVTCAEGSLTIEVADDGTALAEGESGGGPRGLADRLAALDGDVALLRRPGGGALLRATIPLAPSPVR